MRPLFYLSCSPTDDYTLIRKFFWDLCDSIQIKAHSSIKRPIGFLDDNTSWNIDAVNALQNCNALIALLSPSYLGSRRAGQEWQTVEVRRQRQLPHLQYQRMSSYTSEGVFVPVIWKPTGQPLPSPVKHELDYARFTHSAPSEGLEATLKRQGTFGSAYIKFVNELAKYLLQLSENTSLPAGDISPTQLAPAFATKTSPNITKPESEPYTIWILEDHKEVREILEEDLLLGGYSVKGFEEAESVEEEMYSDILRPKLPDLFIVDLVLRKNRMQGLDFIRKMDRKPSATPPIIAISGHLPSSVLVQAIDAGAWATFSKPINMIEFHKKVTKFTAIGRKKRDFTMGQIDPNRLRRPVFLSYKEEDRQKASSLRNQIEAIDIAVWYASETVPPGDKWRPEVRKGIEEAKVFIAILSDTYSHSGPCMAELNRFYERLSTESNPLLLLPVVYNLSQEGRSNPTIRHILRDHHYIDMSSDDDFLDALTALLFRLQREIFPHD